MSFLLPILLALLLLLLVIVAELYAVVQALGKLNAEVRQSWLR